MINKKSIFMDCAQNSCFFIEIFRPNFIRTAKIIVDCHSDIVKFKWGIFHFYIGAI